MSQNFDPLFHMYSSLARYLPIKVLTFLQVNRMFNVKTNQTYKCTCSLTMTHLQSLYPNFQAHFVQYYNGIYSKSSFDIWLISLRYFTWNRHSWPLPSLTRRFLHTHAFALYLIHILSVWVNLYMTRWEVIDKWNCIFRICTFQSHKCFIT